MKLYRDASGDPRAHLEKGTEKGKALLARFLESDVQGSAALGRQILAALDQVASGHRKSWERTGNAYTLALAPGGATIEPAMDEDDAEPLHLPLAELRDAVERWVAFIAE
jgi:uncharacterized protein YacL (UPF0231 family)